MNADETKNIISKNLQYYMEQNNINNRELAKITGVSESTVGKWLLKKSTPRMGVIENLANYFGIEKSDLIEDKQKSTDHSNKDSPKEGIDYMRVNVYGSVPAGITIEAIEDITDTEDLSFKDYDRNKTYIGLKVRGDSMYPKYLDGDTIIIEVTPCAENGQDTVVYVNGYEASLKRFHKSENGIITLEPLNTNYSPKSYGENDEPIKVLGVVKEIRRKV